MDMATVRIKVFPSIGSSYYVDFETDSVIGTFEHDAEAFIEVNLKHVEYHKIISINGEPYEGDD
jgi:hypothetical protein